MWAVQWPSSETEAAADATLATGASGPGSLFLPPARLRRSAFRLVLERLEPPSLPSAADAAPPAPEARAPPAPPASPIQSRRAGRCDATPPSCRQQLARTRKSGIARLSAPRRAARPSRRAGAAFAAAPQTHTSLDRDWAEGAWCPRHSVACSLETYVHLGHDPFESGQSHFLAAIPDATVLVELPDGWYAPREAVAAAHAGAAGDGAAMRGATLLPPPLQPPPGLRSPEAASPNPSLSPPALPPGAAGRDSAPASPSRGGAAGPPIGGPGADPQTTAAYLDIRRSFDGIRRLAQLQAAIEAETAEISRLRAAGGGRWAQGWAAGEPPARAEPAPAAARERGPGASQLEALRREAATCGALAAAEEAAAEAEEAAAAEEDRLAAEAEAELAMSPQQQQSRGGSTSPRDGPSTGKSGFKPVGSGSRHSKSPSSKDATATATATAAAAEAEAALAGELASADSPPRRRAAAGDTTGPVITTPRLSSMPVPGQRSGFAAPPEVAAAGSASSVRRGSASQPLASEGLGRDSDVMDARRQLAETGGGAAASERATPQRQRPSPGDQHSATGKVRLADHVGPHHQWDLSLCPSPPPDLSKILPLTDRQSYFCSELVAAAWMEAGILPADRDPAWFWPRHFVDGGAAEGLLGRGFVLEGQVEVETAVPDIAGAETTG
mmetsp:Transcript_3157/g.13005  ORF Transcript_3157/g.13005 Transcript_3157/m.13005 type:complete len:670 (-) Transcript_3157:225-2234(-)